MHHNEYDYNANHASMIYFFNPLSLVYVYVILSIDDVIFKHRNITYLIQCGYLITFDTHNEVALLKVA